MTWLTERQTGRSYNTGMNQTPPNTSPETPASTGVDVVLIAVSAAAGLIALLYLLLL